MICRHILYHFMVANLVLPRRVSGAVKRVFATVGLKPFSRRAPAHLFVVIYMYMTYIVKNDIKQRHYEYNCN